MEKRRTDFPTRPVIFRRTSGFYMVLVYADESHAELGEHAALNPGTLSIEDLEGNVLWRPQ